MKNLRQFFAAVVLMLLLTFSAIAGDIQAPGVSIEPPSLPQTAPTGDMGSPKALALDPLAEITLKMLESILSIF